MIGHYLLVMMRRIQGHRMYSSIIFLSLTVGLLFSYLMISFLTYETAADRHHLKASRIFQVVSNDPFAETGRLAYVPVDVSAYVKDHYPEVENVCQIATLPEARVRLGTQEWSEMNIALVDTTFSKLFDFKVVAGEWRHSGRSSVITAVKAMQLFGTTSAAGRVLSIVTRDTTLEVPIAAVVDTGPFPSHLSFDILLDRHLFGDQFRGGALYTLLAQEEQAQSLEHKLSEDTQRPGLVGPGKVNYFFTPLSECYFSSYNRMPFMKTRNPLFITVGYVLSAVVMLMAAFNFVSLFLLFDGSRRKEMGIRKTLGMSRSALYGSSVLEVSLYMVVSLVSALLIGIGALPFFNDQMGGSLTPQFLFSWQPLAALSLLVFITGLGVVFVRSENRWRTETTHLISRSQNRQRGNGWIFVIQFSLSIVLLISSITIARQMKYVEEAPLGFNRYLIQAKAPDGEADKLSVLKGKLLQWPAIQHAAVSTGNPVFGNWIARYDLEDGSFYSPFLFSGDEQFFETLGLQLVAGRLPSRCEPGKVVNEKLVSRFQLFNPIGKRIPGTEDVIVGVVRDFTCGSFKQEIPPAILSYSDNGDALLIDYQGADLSTVIPFLQEQWRSVFPDFTFSYRLIQDELMKKYNEEQVLSKVLITGAFICMVLATFGLFALSWATAQQRTREMCIRKVHGATILNVLKLLTVSYTSRIMIAFMVAAPVSYWLMSEWLSRFANRIEWGLSIFLFAGALVATVALVTLSYQTITLAFVNPLDEIKHQ